ncbi:transcriptional regulator [Cellulomonas sp. WB94]|uniref:GAF and ANTAR domain-containing protein n=1 Tax=Cellulomonas sp. WB94 TaxID=2173174 RepID=UPI000D5835DC|nr:GAF and ANTAR domain-containing protein [Cellulomonas sp. WB94]PVU82662.1 transcriptional regulator [Cellulomonas sp. WB94]
MTTQQRLAEVFVELADTLVDDFDVVDLLQTLTDRTVELLDADASGLMLADQRGDLKLMASTLERARLVELFELQVAEGPCRECFTTGLPITNVDLSDAMERWPRFTPVAVEAGFRATHALPMRLRGQIIGVLNIFTEKAVPLSEDDIAVGQAMADIATIGLLNERTHYEQVRLSEQLQTALQSRILIEQAKGVLSARADLSVDEAFNQMRHHARSTGMTLSVVARSVIDKSLDLRTVGSA